MTVYQQLALLFFFIITGFVARKCSVIDDRMMKGLNNLILTIAFPCLILHRTVNMEMESDAFVNFLSLIAVSIAAFLMFGGYAFLYAKFRKFPSDDAPVAELSFFAPNNGFLGFPVALAFFGDRGLFYMVACNLALNFVFFSYGILLLRRGTRTEPVRLAKRIGEFLLLIVNPKISAAVIGVILCYNRVRLPELADAYLSSIGNLATPLTMIFIGATLTESKVSEIVKNRYVIETALNKLIVIPALALLIVRFLPISPLAKMIFFVGNALPVATSSPILSRLHDRNHRFASEALFVSTILSIATIPLSVLLANHIF